MCHTCKLILFYVDITQFLVNCLFEKLRMKRSFIGWYRSIFPSFVNQKFRIWFYNVQLSYNKKDVASMWDIFE